MALEPVSARQTTRGLSSLGPAVKYNRLLFPAATRFQGKLPITHRSPAGYCWHRVLVHETREYSGHKCLCGRSPKLPTSKSPAIGPNEGGAMVTPQGAFKVPPEATRSVKSHSGHIYRQNPVPSLRLHHSLGCILQGVGDIERAIEILNIEGAYPWEGLVRE